MWRKTITIVSNSARLHANGFEQSGIKFARLEIRMVQIDRQIRHRIQSREQAPNQRGLASPHLAGEHAERLVLDHQIQTLCRSLSPLKA